MHLKAPAVNAVHWRQYPNIINVVIRTFFFGKNKCSGKWYRKYLTFKTRESFLIKFNVPLLDEFKQAEEAIEIQATILGMYNKSINCINPELTWEFHSPWELPKRSV